MSLAAPLAIGASAFGAVITQFGLDGSPGINEIPGKPPADGTNGGDGQPAPYLTLD